MNITQADGSFWQAVKAPTWLAGNKRPNKVASLHMAINGHAKAPYKLGQVTKPAIARLREARMEKSNALNILGMVRKRGEDVYLYMIQASIEYKSVQPKRCATYRRWLRQIEQRKG